MRSLFIIASLLLLSSCSSPPKPPSVDEATRRPANSGAAVELQACRGELQNTRIRASESGRIAESAAAALARTSARQGAAGTVCTSTSALTGNSVYSIRFGFGSARVAVRADSAAALVDEARSAPLVLLRGRTDGTVDSGVESRVARERAMSVREYLIGAGVDPARIRTTYQPSGDFAADNSSPSGRSINRRVEIEVYRAAPVAVGAATATAATATPGATPAND